MVFYFLNFDAFVYNEKKYISIFVINDSVNVIHKINILYDDKKLEFLSNLKKFTDVSNHIKYKFRKDGTILLDFNI